MPYEETEPKQLMVENNYNNNIAESEAPNIVNTNNDKDEQNITKTTESVEVPPHI